MLLIKVAQSKIILHFFAFSDQLIMLHLLFMLVSSRFIDLCKDVFNHQKNRIYLVYNIGGFSCFLDYKYF